MVCTSQAANRETGANCKNLSLHRGKAVIKQRFQTGSVDEVCFLGKLLPIGYGLEMLDSCCLVSLIHPMYVMT